jgi:hypothetical protein
MEEDVYPASSCILGDDTSINLFVFLLGEMA